MKKYTYLNTTLFRSGAIQLYRVFDTETREIYYLATSKGKSAVSSQSFTGTRKEANLWRQSMGSN